MQVNNCNPCTSKQLLLFHQKRETLPTIPTKHCNYQTCFGPKSIMYWLVATGNSIISGSGNFSDVYEGNFKDSLMASRKVAIKVLKAETNYKEFFKEAFAASDLNHENIVEFLGICIEPTNMIIFEFMEGGELLTYLRCDEQQQKLTAADLMEMICDVCKGCAYMELMKFVHRDLAARNCLLTSTNPLIRKVK